MEATELNVVETIERTNIKGFVPKTAEYGLLNPSGKFIQKFYKFGDVKFNDGTKNNILYYYGEQGGWHPSSYNDNERNKLNMNKFIKII